MKNKIYKIKDSTDLNEFGRLGYDIVSGESATLIKFIPQPIDGKLAKDALQYIYENPEWKEKVYNKHKKMFRTDLGLRYNREGKAILSKMFTEILTKWRIQIEVGPTDDKWIGFTSSDRFDHTVFYGKQILDTYCSEEIQSLLEKGLIEEIEVDG